MTYKTASENGYSTTIYVDITQSTYVNKCVNFVLK
jgi:hypothetical protein